MCTKRTSVYAGSAGAGRARRATSAASSGVGGDAGGGAASYVASSTAMPEIIEVEPVVGSKPRVMLESRGVTLGPFAELRGPGCAREPQVGGERLEV